MDEAQAFQKFEKQYKNLLKIIEESHIRTTKEEPDSLFSENINFFIKAYLINICTYLEAFLQEIALLHLEEIKKSVTNASIPHNLIIWCLKNEHKSTELKFSEFQISKNKDDISDQLSGNPYKTIKTFALLGVDLKKNPKLMEHKDIVQTIVSKRNNIIHHNDEASDITLKDLKSYIPIFIEYSKAVTETTFKAATNNLKI